MPIVDDFPQRPRSGPPFHEADDGWAMPIGTISGLRIYLSYSVFVAAAILASVLWLSHSNQGNGDLPIITLIGLAFWIVGWIVQFSVYAFYRFALAVEIESITIGLLGVESRVRSWEAKTALIVTLSSLASLVLVGSGVVLAEQFVNGTKPWEQLFAVLRAPSFGLGSADFLWIAGAWLCWIQALFQLCPMPRSTGRVTIVALVTLLTEKLSEPLQTHFCKRAIQLIAFSTALIAIASLVKETDNGFRHWPLLFFLAVFLWISARAADVRELVLGFSTFSHWERDGLQADAEVQQALGWVERARHAIGSAARRRRLRRVLENERQEAMDADRLDDVLNRLHQHGRESLADADIALLQRVSERVKREREKDVAQ